MNEITVVRPSSQLALDTMPAIRLMGRRWNIKRLFPSESGDGFMATMTHHKLGNGSIIVSQAVYSDDSEWLHASIAYSDNMPRYEDLSHLHLCVFGRKRWAYQVFTPQAAHVNFHRNALHLWGRIDGANMLPVFMKEGRI